MSLVWPARISNPTARLVLLRLADRAHDDGSEARPSVESLARDCSLSPRQTQRHLRWLERSGFIEVDRAESQHRPRSYRINLAKLRGDMGDTPDARRDGGIHVTSGRSSGATSEVSGDDTYVTPEAPRDDTDVTQTVLQNYNHPEKNRHTPPLPPQGGEREERPRHRSSPGKAGRTPVVESEATRRGHSAKRAAARNARAADPRCVTVIQNHQRLFRERMGTDLLIRNREHDEKALEPLLELYGLETTLDLQRHFFEIDEPVY